MGDVVKKHYSVTVQVHEVTPAWVEARYSNQTPIKHDRQIVDLLSLSSQDTDELEVLADAIAYLEVRREKLLAQQRRNTETNG